MKLSDHVEHIRLLIYKAFNNQFSRLGVGPTKMVGIDKIPADLHSKRNKIEVLIKSHSGETGSYIEAREKALDELTFTLFNRLAAVKVMEAHQLFPPMVTKEAEHGDRSFGHKMWLEENPDMRHEELEGLRAYFKHEFNQLGESIPLFHKNYPYALLPYVIELNEIIEAFNAVSEDNQVADDIWESDDILGWLYESYNTLKRKELKDSSEKIEFDKVRIQACLYTPRWVVEFLVENSLGKLYLEMYPDSDIKYDYKIAKAPQTRIRETKPLHEIKLIDPASGSGNFLLYAFEFFYRLYQDQIDNFGADYDEDDIPQLIIENNLHGIDLDDRAIQLAQLGLWIKAKQKRRSIGKLKFNIVSSDFFLPDFEDVASIFKKGTTDSKQLEIIEEIWTDLQQAYKFGSLVRLEEKLSLKLHGLVDQRGITLFGDQELEEYKRFENAFLSNLETAVVQHASQQGNSFLTDKTKDAITFLRLITQKYDVATANPPYTDSGDFGPDLKKFIESNYKKPYRFHTNLYATFIKRCFELTNNDGKVAMIHPNTFMFIKTFEHVREFIINYSFIELFIDHGQDRINVFDSNVSLDACYYVIGKGQSNILNKIGTYFYISNTVQEREKKELFEKILINLINENPDDRIFVLQQSKLNLIKSSPFIYWISDDFREKFGEKSLAFNYDVSRGLNPGVNEKYLRFTNEVINDRYKPISKGGPYIKWYGAVWTCIDLENNIDNIQNEKYSSLSGSEFYFREGIVTPRVGSKGPSFKYKSSEVLFSDADLGIFPKDKDESPFYALGVLNSKVVSYISYTLNPTVNITVGDIERIPLFNNNDSISSDIENLSERNYNIYNTIYQNYIIELQFKLSPLSNNLKVDLIGRVKTFLTYEINLKSQIIINEAIIDEHCFKLFGLSESDKAMILKKKGESIGGLPISPNAKRSYLTNEIAEFPLDNIKDYIESLPEQEFDELTKETITNQFQQLFQSNNDLEEFCIHHQINPINVWYLFKESNIVPKQRMNDLALEFLADLLREILMEDDDGIIPLVPNAGEKVLLDRIEEKFIEKGFSMAQYSTFDSVLGRELNDFINNRFFNVFSNHLNLFRHLPMTPFIWHLTSGPEQGFDCYIIIYKWNRDKLLSIRSRYIEQRERSLENRQSDLRAKSTLSASEQNELDKIYKQLKEIESFKQKIDELLAEGYNPVLDDGVGKNIAPLQKKKMIAYDVLNAGQLKKYLNADW
ncbi:Eco57I restriction-modification methylase domain-containing protein [Mangrovimonas sp. DI 80]|uniref:Eco57I restriction-modification methylase domain-containing protein n=1 Tax=Mangrovimonas sp. DI 80 TaxID=1779330 RepID=UPI000977E6E6|nr:DNA methyltransferase [Mangrovimonas sp. DI 80]OMP32279.1 restriction endonuclease [Mangrovimonas sp. DI 80]